MTSFTHKLFCIAHLIYGYGFASHLLHTMRQCSTFYWDIWIRDAFKAPINYAPWVPKTVQGRGNLTIFTIDLVNSSRTNSNWFDNVDSLRNQRIVMWHYILYRFNQYFNIFHKLQETILKKVKSEFQWPFKVNEMLKQ